MDNKVIIVDNLGTAGTSTLNQFVEKVADIIWDFANGEADNSGASFIVNTPAGTVST